MDLETKTVLCPEIVFSQTKEQSIDTDLLLPDYYPEISKLLDCSVTLREEAVTVTADKISIAGAACVRLLYASAENTLKTYEVITKYTKLISGAGFETGDVCIVRQNPASLNYRAVSPRKVEVRAVVAVKAELIRLRQFSYICDLIDPNVQKRPVTKECFSVGALSVLRFEFSDKISLPVPRQKIGGIVRAQVRLQFSDVRSAHHKLMLGGAAEISFVYLTEQNTVSAEQTVNLPFTQICELYGAEEGDRCCVGLTYADIDIDLKNASCGENEAQVRICASAAVVAGRPSQLSFVADAYSLRENLNLQTQAAGIVQNAPLFTDVIPVAGEFSSIDMQIADVYAPCVADVSFNVTQEENALTVHGSYTLKLMANTSDGACYCFSRSFAFEHVCRTEQKAFAAAVCVCPHTVRAEKGTDGVLRFSGELRLSGFALTGETTSLLTGCEPGEALADVNEKIVLYYAEKGESAWQIAKENQTAFNSLMELNALKNETLSESKMLVFH